MLELNRILLRNFGPVEARYEHVNLDLSGAGEPVDQIGLIGGAESGQVETRPAAASLLLLPNGGGKGVLLHALQSTITPFRHRDTESLKKFTVSMRQPTHVAIEWANRANGKLLVTGQLLGLTSGGELARQFYAFRPSAALDADRLPFTRDGKWTPYDAYLTFLQEQRSNTALEMDLKDTQEAWEQLQTRLGLDPDLFAIQWKMNASEGAAGDAFSRSSGKHFIEWLLRQVTPTERFQPLEERFAHYRHEVTQHDGLRLQNAYATAMEGACHTVHNQHQRQLEADGAAGAAAAHLSALRKAIDDRVELADETLSTSSEQLEAAKKQVLATNAALDLANRRRSHVTMVEHELLYTDAQAQAQSAKNALQPAELESEAWGAVGLYIDERAAADDLDELQTTLAREEGIAQQASARRDRAAARARAGYSNVIAATEADLTAQQAGLRRESDQIRAWRTTTGELRQQIASANAEARQHQQQIAAAEKALQSARDDGLLGPDETTAAAKTRATQEADTAETRASAAKTTLTSAETHAGKTAADARNLQTQAQDAASESKALQRDLARWRVDGKRIVDRPLVGEITETDREALDAADPLVWLDEHAAGIVAQCQSAASTIQAEQTEPRRESEDAERLLRALDISGGLLPPRPAVARLLSFLRDHEIAAVAGWRWLSDSCPSGDHARIIATWPELADGIIVNDRTAVAEAKELLVDAELLPDAAVTIAASDEVLRNRDDAGAGRYVPRPTPALHDSDAAERERAAVEDRYANARSRLERLQTRLTAVTELAHEVQAWHRGLGEEHAADLIARAKIAADHAETLETQADEADTTASEAAEALTTARTALEEARESHTRLRGNLERLARLDQLVSDAEALKPLLDRITTENQRHTQQIATLESRIEHAEATLEDLRERAAATKVELAEHKTAMEAITCTAEAEQHQRQETAPLPNIAALVAELQRAELAFQQAAIDDGLRRRATDVEAELQRLQRDWGAVDEQVKERARELSTDPRAKARPQRRVAAETARASLARLRQDNDDRGQAEAQAKERLEQHRPKRGRATWLDADEDPQAWTPADLESVEALIAKAEALIIDATATHQDAQRKQKTITQEVQNQRERQQRLQIIQSRVTGAARSLPTAETAADLPADLEELDTTATAAINRFDACRKTAGIAADGLKKAVSDLKIINERHDFAGVDFPLQGIISNFPEAHMPGTARTWAQSLEQFRATIATDLSQADTRRQHIVETLTTHAREALWLLRTAHTAARVPAGNSPWAGKTFLDIKFASPADATIAASARATVDRIAHQTRQTAISGIDLALACLRDAVPTGFDVKILKPTPGGGTTMVPIERMAKEFSGGQDLTGSILLYCVMAILKQTDRARRRDAHGGTLFLDNPLGRANADYLMRLQFQIARAMNVQLICTTPLSEDRAIMHFPLQIHMINDSSIRQGTGLIRISKQARATIAPPPLDPDPDAEAPNGIIGAAQIHKKDGPE